MNNISTMLEAESKSNLLTEFNLWHRCCNNINIYCKKMECLDLHYTGDFFITLCIVIFSLKKPFSIWKQGFNEFNWWINDDT